MATIEKNVNYMALPIAIQRGNPIPLDTSAIWYSETEMTTYAKESPVAYVGQLLTYVDETNKVVKVYAIKNTDGELLLLASSSDEGNYLALTGGTMTGDITLRDGYTAVSSNYVAQEILKAGHAKYTIVDALPEKSAAETNCIYLVKDDTATGDDKYKQYIYVAPAEGETEGQFIQIGDTSIDLSDYLQKSGTLVKGNLLTVDDDGKVVDTGVAAPGEGDTYITETLLTKLKNLSEIKSIGDKLSLDSDGKLDVAKVDGSYVFNGRKVFDLENSSYNMDLTDTTYANVQLVTDIFTAHEAGDDISVKYQSNIYNVVEFVDDTTSGIKGVVLAASTIDTTNLAETMFKRIFIMANGTTETKVFSATCPSASDINDTIANYLTDNHYVTTADIATETTPGVVLASSADDGVNVDSATGAMSVNSLNVNKLYQTEGDELILAGGDSGATA